MASNVFGRDEFERRFSNLTGYVDHSLDQIKVTVVTEIRASESRTQEKIEASEKRLLDVIAASEARTQEKINALRERHDVEMAQVHSEFGQIREVLMWMAQRLPPEPIGPPPAQFLKYDDTEKA